MRKLSEIKKDWEAATPGQWSAEKENCHTGGVATCHGDGHPWWEVWTPGWAERGIDPEANAKAIANAPTDIKDLLDWVERAKVEMKEAVALFNKSSDPRNAPFIRDQMTHLLKELNN